MVHVISILAYLGLCSYPLQKFKGRGPVVDQRVLEHKIFYALESSEEVNRMMQSVNPLLKAQEEACWGYSVRSAEDALLDEDIHSHDWKKGQPCVFDLQIRCSVRSNTAEHQLDRTSIRPNEYETIRRLSFGSCVKAVWEICPWEAFATSKRRYWWRWQVR